METPRARVTARLFDGNVVTAAGAWMAAADRYAFEERFGLSLPSLFGARVGKDGKIADEELPSVLASLQERYLAFFAHRLLVREGKFFGTFEEFTEQVADLEIEALPGNVSAPAPPPG